MTIENSEEFMVEEFYATKVVVGEAKITWESFNFAQRQVHMNQIQRNNVIIHDSFLNLGQIKTFDYYSTIVTEI